MAKLWRVSMRIRAITFCVVLIVAAASVTSAQTFTLLHVFHGPDGGDPEAPLLLGSDGTLYGTTSFGGASGLGTAFTIDKKNKQKVLHSFTGGSDGQDPLSGLVFGSDGNLYGTASGGGATGFGTLFRIGPGNQFTTLYNFQGNPKSSEPVALIAAGDKFFGSAASGGGFFSGTVFQLDRTGEKLLYGFVGGADGSGSGGLMRDTAGNLYGASGGGNLTCNAPFGCGLIFRIDSGGNYSVLHVFVGPDGMFPQGPLVRDAGGNLYGVTISGGALNSGTVFKLTPAGILTTLYSFTGGADGEQPHGGLVRDSAGNLFGTAFAGGIVNDTCFGFGCGVVFQLSPTGATWTQTVLHSFNGNDGDNPLATLTLHPTTHTLYGSAHRGGDYNCHTINGGTSCGVIFKIMP
jgi:uncharacterized repeat protein (TIGR03803 family)